MERLIVSDFKREAKGHKERLYQNHRVRKSLEQMQERSSKLVGHLILCHFADLSDCCISSPPMVRTTKMFCSM